VCVTVVCGLQWCRCQAGASTSRGTPTALSSSRVDIVAILTSASSAAGRATHPACCREPHATHRLSVCLWVIDSMLCWLYADRCARRSNACWLAFCMHALRYVGRLTSTSRHASNSLPTRSLQSLPVFACSRRNVLGSNHIRGFRNVMRSINLRFTYLHVLSLLPYLHCRVSKKARNNPDY